MREHREARIRHIYNQIVKKLSVIYYLSTARHNAKRPYNDNIRYYPHRQRVFLICMYHTYGSGQVLWTEHILFEVRAKVRILETVLAVKSATKRRKAISR